MTISDLKVGRKYLLGDSTIYVLDTKGHSVTIEYVDLESVSYRKSSGKSTRQRFTKSSHAHLNFEAI